MGVLREDILHFIAIDNGYGDGSGYGDGYGDGSGDGYGSGYGDGSGDGYGSGSGDGYGSGSGDGYSSGYGYGYGDGSGYGSGSGSGSGYGSGVKSINGDPVYLVDGVQTIFKAIRGNVAQGFILQKSLLLRPCYIVKEGGKFAHGDTLHDAYGALMEKIYVDCPVEERIAKFNAEHPDHSRKYPARDLFHWHHVLTGSCKAGREAFCKDHCINVDTDSFTVNEFVALTRDSYGGDIIRQLIYPDKNA